MLGRGKLISRDRAIWKIVLFLLFAACFFVFIVEPFFKEKRILNEQLACAKNRLIKYRQLLKEEDAIRKTYNQFFSPTKRIAEADLSTSALKELQEIANKSSIKIIDIRQNRAIEGEFPEIAIELRAQAAEENYVTFIYLLRTSGLLFYIKNFTLQEKEKDKLLEASFLISYMSGL